MTVHHLHGILGGGAVSGRVVESRPWSRCYDLSVVVVVVMVMGVQCLGMLGRHMKSGFLDWMSLYSDRFWSYDSRPYYWWMIRLSRLHKVNQKKKKINLEGQTSNSFHYLTREAKRAHLRAKVVTVYGWHDCAEMPAAVPMVVSWIGSCSATGACSRRSS